jgi:hypothetical protein
MIIKTNGMDVFAMKKKINIVKITTFEGIYLL